MDVTGVSQPRNPEPVQPISVARRIKKLAPSSGEKNRLCIGLSLQGENRAMLLPTRLQPDKDRNNISRQAKYHIFANHDGSILGEAQYNIASIRRPSRWGLGLVRRMHRGIVGLMVERN
jgi:hypothetical protein